MFEKKYFYDPKIVERMLKVSMNDMLILSSAFQRESLKTLQWNFVQKDSFMQKNDSQEIKIKVTFLLWPKVLSFHFGI